ncbi:GAF domain-containing sensor histidine kinase [Skermanella mucosa]|uniref:GAF domain-containing sensor histidine kinase n=1 Tax=Skermanella mucosa TaxID=1789672 RepID=UPI00192BBAEA|nr:GAF domain-containing sensor histidine kinase [Skermanella mucosa]UEM18754.1 GAF domain-containing sensor histidine kinase [Skermanella mucosa]
MDKPEERQMIAADLSAIGRIGAVPSILEVVAETTGMGFVTVARVTEGTWTACAVLDRISFGLRVGGELDVSTTLCSEVRDSRLPIIIDDAEEDPRYCDHHTPKLFNIRSYISYPIFRVNGDYFGTLCAVDRRPTKVSDPRITAMMESFSRLIGMQLETEERHLRAQADLLDEQQTSELREQFIAVLGHDLRNPLFAIESGANLLLRRPLDPTSLSIVEHMRASSLRASRLVGDVLDFARGRLGGGIPLDIEEAPNLEQTLRHVIAELQAIHPDRSIRNTFDISETVSCDPDRIAQLLSNLLTNAVTHGASDQPVDVSADTGGGSFVLSVTNQGPPIPADMLPKLFRPFQRSVAAAPRDGLGIGLYIASQIAESHGGRMDAFSSAECGTTFRFSMPLRGGRTG